jgi:phosphoribosylanthranilate isomerase
MRRDWRFPRAPRRWASSPDDWQVSRKIRDRADVPVFLAGGLHAGNVAAAIAQVQPFGIDLCSGVRVDGRLSASRLAEFTHAVRRECGG